MNEVVKTILKRRSTRAYTPSQISEEELHVLLETARFAPSGMNRQPWHFTVVQNPETLHRINEACRQVLLGSGVKAMEERAKGNNFSICYQAPTLILVAVDEQVHTGRLDGAVALENMFLAAESMGLGSCWIHAVSMLFNGGANEELRKELHIPAGFVVIGSGAFGHKAAEAQAAPRKENTITVLK
ncbi:nitroreductase family protein [Holophaga foetida]|uniref:nitroreductase family protein n=1 Tax=Holophaga foetida TaxID=35839 RepID=UPI0002473378|nr:nitroreductase [Holophaga foetida]